jgi:hypothetical protein
LPIRIDIIERLFQFTLQDFDPAVGAGVVVDGTHLATLPTKKKDRELFVESNEIASVVAGSELGILAPFSMRW